MITAKTKMSESLDRVIKVFLGVAIVTVAATPMQLSGQSVQRLFSTPALRAELDRLRIQVASGIVIEQPITEDSFFEPVVNDDPEVEEAELVYILGGSMRKSDGSYTVWINDVAYDQSNLPSNMELLSPFSQGKLRISDSTSSFDVKPGQVLNLTTGQLFESYQYQSVLAATIAEAARLPIDDASGEDSASESIGNESSSEESPEQSAAASALERAAAVGALLETTQDL